ncbi:MAG: ATP-binding protein [Candidatus Eremiobacteraeota bacterium]|nr:ATP-binding protein [Candidatus Eremiobacteraeota bacterium]
MRCTFVGNSLHIEVRDTGRGFQQTAQQQQDLSGAPTSGFGLGIMRAFMNSITFAKNGTMVTMVRHLSPLQKGSNGHPH